MEIIFTAILGEVASRSLSFLIGKCLDETKPTADEMLHELRRLLLRVRVIVEEAEERDITNKAMLQQLNMLRKEMYRGYYILDSLRSNQANQEVSHSFALSNFNPAKRLFLSGSGVQRVKALLQVSQNLRSIIADMDEFVAFTKNYSPLYRQPYSMQLFLDKCMFGRQMEADRVMNFLMQPGPSTGESIGALPIIGPAGVGKSTLVAHVYSSERVRSHFSRIVLFTQDDLIDKQFTTLKDGGVVIHQKDPLDNEIGRLLAIIELSGDIDEVAWSRLYLASAGCLETGSKIILTSRSNKIVKFGTTQALMLNFLPQEAYWYFFKVLTFGSADPEDQPKLESFALEIVREMNGSFVFANIVSGFLRSNIYGLHWYKVLACLRDHLHRTMSLPSEQSYHHLMQKNKPMYVRRIDKSNYFVFYSRYQTSFPYNNTIPKTTLHDFLSGWAKYHGRFEVLAWKSHIPPYTTYIISCGVHSSQDIKNTSTTFTSQG